ncbi:Membrane protein of unknown function (DUF340) [Halobacteroides halobius DSM 5150]|uniref:DUF340 domain-containing protein n=1 Tax=Halobacteroides halobius (strain ATCC 35273 / DSM 5150 / MD-1) TaxID=748449 RepID=L0KBF7_HALHC|nr:LysO family transporter [Halobacteroides halobius]AGB41714.1 Membrane protein of unknown function (DUF340) [Halobacteroides halobius DSM 5150]
MWLIIGSLIIGLTIGFLDLVPDNVAKFSDYLVLGGLFLLLFTMGVEIGANPQILSNLEQIGFKAIILAVGSIIGSIILILFFELSGKED